MSEGFSYQGAADRLYISINTVRSHVRNIYEKLHVHSRSQAAHEALKQESSERLSSQNVSGVGLHVMT
jgi:DNA-binding NarL/FixJ family response regulator